MTDVYTIFVENRSADRFQLSREVDVENKRPARVCIHAIRWYSQTLRLFPSSRVPESTIIKFAFVSGDSKDATREKAQMVLLKIMEKGCMSPQNLLDRLRPAFNHKNAKLREEALILLTTTLNEWVAILRLLEMNYIYKKLNFEWIC